MKLMFLLPGAILLTGVSHAAEVSEFNYQVDQIVPGFSVRMIEEGYPLGHNSTAPTITIHKDEPALEILGQAAQDRAAELGTLKNASHRIAAKLLNGTAGSSAAETLGASGAGTSTSAAAPGPRPVDLDAFAICARSALPLLKSALAAQVRNDLVRRDTITAALDFDREDEDGTNVGGMACGKQLGAAAVTRGELREEIKALTALTARSGLERAELLEVFVASHHRDRPLRATGLWRYFWRRISVIAALTDHKLPTVKELMVEIQDTPPEQLANASGTTVQPGVSISVKYGNLDELRKIGADFARTVIR